MGWSPLSWLSSDFWRAWLKNANCFGGRPWLTALTDANTLAPGACGLTDGSVAGDWRLPNVQELQSLIDYELVPRLPRASSRRTVMLGFLGSLDALTRQHLAALGIRHGFGNEWIKIGGLKGFVDGIMGNSSARFYEPYLHSGKRGSWRTMMEPPGNMEKLHLGAAAHGADPEVVTRYHEYRACSDVHLTHHCTHRA